MRFHSFILSAVAYCEHMHSYTKKCAATTHFFFALSLSWWATTSKNWKHLRVLFAVAVVFLEEANEKMRNAWDMSTFGVFMAGMKASAGAWIVSKGQ